jgi:hypothetical protein
MKVSEHLATFHKAAHGHHTQMIAAHETALKKAQDMEEGEHHVKFHKTAIANHQEMAGFHEGAMEDCQKAVAAADLAKQHQLVPDGIRGIVPDRPTITPVPRYGQREMSKADVPPEFAHLVEIDD